MTIQTIRSPLELRRTVHNRRAQGQRIALVPTMGALHEGHLCLLREARKQCDFLVMSLFVNPSQFRPNEDLERYPRDELSDVAKAKKCGVDLVFCPQTSAMYPAGFQTAINLAALAAPLCGQTRPDHFSGVATVVAKLFNLVQPHIAVFGRKDAQQLALIQQMVKDLDFDIKILSVPIVREHDGLAMSSRNVFLTPEQRAQAPLIARGLFDAQATLSTGITDSETLAATARTHLNAASLAVIDYLEIRDEQTLANVTTVETPCLILVAVWFGETRLIDNVSLTPLAE